MAIGMSQVRRRKKIKPGSFQGLGLSDAMNRAVMKMGYKMPTPIQRKTIPTVLEGQDMVAMARTGSGKTAAFLIPICERLDAHSVAVGVRAVVLSPTRELAMQTAKFFRQLSRFKGLRCCLLVGGQAMETQFEHLASNPDVVIATPGRLMHHMLEAELSLSRIEMLVFDEADRLFELGFAEQLHKILEATPSSRQVLLFSATLPAQLVAFTRAGIKNPAIVRLDVETTLSEQLDLWFLYARKDEKLAATIAVLRKLFKNEKSTIMFVATKHHCEFFNELLPMLGLTVATVYGSMDQEAREAEVARFRKKKAGILVTTDVAARGIDIPLLDHVVNFDFPPSSKLFVHRTGRTARAGRSGLAVSMVTLEDLPYTVELLLFLGRKLAVASGLPQTEEFTPGATPIIGAIPSVQLEVENLNQLLSDKGTQLVSLHKSMMQSYHVYNKMRPSASKSSVARSKEMLEECGGPARLQGCIHPAFCEDVGLSTDAKSVAKATSDRAFLDGLRGFRPQIEKVGNVISPGAMKTMGLAKKDAAITAEVRKSALGETAQILESGSRRTEKNKARKRKQPPQEKEVEEIIDKPRVSKSKRRRMKSGQGGASGAAKKSLDAFDDFDVKIDGTAVHSASEAAVSQDKAPVTQFYLSVERNADEEAKERGLNMEEYQMDLVGDEQGSLAQSKSVVKWDAKKKKYLPVMVAADGRVVKQTRKKNESGVGVSGEAEKSGLYQKWARTTKKRIQKIGELEHENQTKVLGKWAKQAAQARTVDFGGDDGDNDDTSIGNKFEHKRKPVVPYHGQIDSKHLTNKQKRMIEKRERKDRIVQGPAKKELRTAIQIQKEKNKRETNKIKQNPHMRKKKAHEAKEVRMKKREEKQMAYGGRTKSRMLIFTGPKKGRIGGKKKKSGRNFLTGSI